MKQIFFKASAAFLLLIVLACIIWIFADSSKPLASETYSKKSDDVCVLGNDFRLRMNEIECVKSGVDPYLVWHLELPLGKYYPFGLDNLRTEEHCNPINAYTPWTYTFMMPVQMLGAHRAWWVHLCAMALAVLVILIVAYKFGTTRNGFVGGCLIAAASLSPLLGIWSDVRSGNLALIIAASSIVMLWLLNRGHEYIAGIPLAIMMMKPQLAVLWVVPLVVLWKFRTLITGGAICLAASILPAVLTGRSVLTLILEAPKASAQSFVGCILLPAPIAQWLATNGWSTGAQMCIPMLIGFSLCAVLTVVLWKRSMPLHFLFMPAAFFSVAWTYSYWHSYCILAILAFPLGELIVSHADRKFRAIALVTLFSCMFGGFYIAKALQLALAVCGCELPLAAIEGIRIAFSFLALVGICWLSLVSGSARKAVAN